MMKKGMTRREREVTDINEIVKILDQAKIAHIGLVDDNMPYVVPMNYGYTLTDGRLTLYIHGATEGRKIDIIRKKPDVFVEIDCDVVPFEGDIACRYGTSYSSVMAEGTAHILDDIDEKREGLKVLMKTQTGKDFEFTDKMVNVVSVIRIDVKEFTAKHRPGPNK